SLRAHDRTLPVIPLSGLLTGLVAVFLMKQPDFGQTIVFGTMWLALLMLSGVSTKIMGGLGVAGIFGIVMAYLFYPVAKLRIDNFLFSEGDTYQTDSARATLTAGGFFGTGPGGGEMKFHLPEAHTDYIFSVIGEEFGLIACIMIAMLFLAIVVRVFVKLLDEEDPFIVLAAAGLTTQFAVQALINMAVNVNLAPSKGMTLPFISYGGSSMIALSAGFGLLLAFTRRNPYLTRSPYVVRWSKK
ncbi:MAG: cell division protein FtsW, partial [Sphingomonadales bacterium]|nr:cell division protein FtsW [Sphingomonadales bacterium]